MLKNVNEKLFIAQAVPVLGVVPAAVTVLGHTIIAVASVILGLLSKALELGMKDPKSTFGAAYIQSEKLFYQAGTSGIAVLASAANICTLAFGGLAVYWFFGGFNRQTLAKT